MRTFETGATRDGETGKLDYEGFLSPAVLYRFAKYMDSKRAIPGGALRDSDNWQLGIPVSAYMKSMWRHFFAVWRSYREGKPNEDEICALLFNVMGMLHEIIRAPQPKYAIDLNATTRGPAPPTIVLPQSHSFLLNGHNL